VFEGLMIKGFVFQINFSFQLKTNLVLKSFMSFIMNSVPQSRGSTVASLFSSGIEPNTLF